MIGYEMLTRVLRFSYCIYGIEPLPTPGAFDDDDFDLIDSDDSRGEEEEEE